MQTHFGMTENRNMCNLILVSASNIYIFEKRNVDFELQKLFFFFAYFCYNTAVG